MVPSRNPFTFSVVPAPTVWNWYCTFPAVVSAPAVSAVLTVASTPPVVSVIVSSPAAAVKNCATLPCTACPPPVAVMPLAVLSVRLFASVFALYFCTAAKLPKFVVALLISTGASSPAVIGRRLPEAPESFTRKPVPEPAELMSAMMSERIAMVCEPLMPVPWPASPLKVVAVRVAKPMPGA